VLCDDIDWLVGWINGDFGWIGWFVIFYLYFLFFCEEMVVFYCAVDVMVVMFFRDGMNFVVKEYVVCCYEDDGEFFEEVYVVVVDVYVDELVDFVGVVEYVCFDVGVVGFEVVEYFV